METNNIFSAKLSYIKASPGPRSTLGAGEYASFYIKIDRALIINLGLFTYADYYSKTLFIQG